MLAAGDKKISRVCVARPAALAPTAAPLEASDNITYPYRLQFGRVEKSAAVLVQDFATAGVGEGW